ncbi:MAG: GreA/GreB family elongation factor [Ectothiorhodospira sp.]
MARALLGRHLDDEVEVHTPGGVVCYEVVEIAYPGAGG